jgi:hypothetical protein
LFSVPDADAASSAHIPIFASVPSKLDARQEASKEYVYKQLQRFGLQPRTVGATDRGLRNPLHEVRTLARHSAGGIILGYRQIRAQPAYRIERRESQRGVAQIYENEIVEYWAPTPWNQLETGIVFGLGLPLLVLKEPLITGGIFDEGAGDVIVYEMPMPGRGWHGGSPDLRSPRVCAGFEDALLRWQAVVRRHYYDEH